MKFTRPRRLSSNIEDRRGAGPVRRGGMGLPAAGGAGGLAVIVALALAFCRLSSTTLASSASSRLGSSSGSSGTSSSSPAPAAVPGSEPPVDRSNPPPPPPPQNASASATMTARPPAPPAAGSPIPPRRTGPAPRRSSMFELSRRGRVNFICRVSPGRSVSRRSRQEHAPTVTAATNLTPLLRYLHGRHTSPLEDSRARRTDRTRDGQTMIITMNRPQRMNAISGAMLVRMYDAYVEASNDDDVRCIIVTGAGGNFCSGADLRAIRATPRTPTPRST